MSRYLSFILSLLFVPHFFVYAKENAQPPSIASTINSVACFIHDDRGRVLVVKELISNKLALPGGFIAENESAKSAVKRETFEETGISVNVLDKIAQLKNTAIYSCQNQFITPIYQLNTGLALIAAWHSESFSREVQAVYLMSPNTDMLRNSRFPEQTSFYLDFLNKTLPSLFMPSENFAELSDNPFFSHSTLSADMQAWVQKMPKPISALVDNILRTGSWFGSLGLFFLLLPLAMAIGGLKKASELAFVLVSAISLVTIIKLVFAIPRPIYLFPKLMLTPEWGGYAFPSLHSTLAFSCWLLVYFWFGSKDKSTLYFFVFPGILTGLSRLYLGTNYLLDIVVGSFLGIGIALLALVFHQRRWLLNGVFWAFSAVISLLLAISFSQTILLFCAVFSFTYSMVLLGSEQRLIALSTNFNPFAFVLSFLGLLLLWLGFEQVPNLSSFKAHILIAQSLLIMLCTIWFGKIIPKACSLT